MNTFGKLPTDLAVFGEVPEEKRKVTFFRN
jgi:hypothetical protein